MDVILRFIDVVLGTSVALFAPLAATVLPTEHVLPEQIFRNSRATHVDVATERLDRLSRLRDPVQDVRLGEVV